MKRRIKILALVFVLFSCKKETNNVLSESQFWYLTQKPEIGSVLLNYGRDVKKDLNIQKVIVAIFIQKNAVDTISIQYVKIDSLNDFLYKKAKQCIDKEGVRFVFLCNDLKIMPKNICKNQIYADSSRAIQDYYPKELLLVEDKIVSDKVINIENLNWLPFVRIEDKKFVPPKVKSSSENQ